MSSGACCKEGKTIRGHGGEDLHSDMELHVEGRRPKSLESLQKLSLFRGTRHLKKTIIYSPRAESPLTGGGSLSNFPSDGARRYDKFRDKISLGNTKKREEYK